MTEATPENQVATKRSLGGLIGVWSLQILLGGGFVAVGITKLMGSDSMVALFQEIGFGHWLRYLTGVLEVAGGVLVLIASTAFWGAALLALVMAGAVMTHLFLIGGNVGWPAVLLLALGATIWLRRPCP